MPDSTRSLLRRLAQRLLRGWLRLAEIDLPTPREERRGPPALRRYSEEFLTNLPSWLDRAKAPASQEEIDGALEIRRQFLFDSSVDSAPYVTDIVRAFRLVEKASLYIEVGTFDKGNLAYTSRLLADDATFTNGLASK